MAVQGSEVQFAKTGLEEFVEDANDAMRFKLVKQKEDVAAEENNFKPEMTHQIYGDNENVFGYRGLKIDMWMTADTLDTYVGFSYDDKISPKRTDGVEPDKILEPLTNILSQGSFVTNKEEFVATVDREREFMPMGEKVHSFTKTDKSGETNQYEVYMAREATPGFRQYHERLQSWIMFYIDAASYIDIDDDSWRFFLLFQKYKVGGRERYAVCGYTTVYEYYAYGRETNMKRPRISQMLILPPYQKRGLGSVLLNTLYKFYWKDSKVVDITVEDPSDNFVRLRDAVDAKNCLALPTYSKDCVKGGFTDSMAKEAATELKLCRKQARRIYEIVRLQYTQINDTEDYRSYRVDVKRRLNIPYEKEKHQLDKLSKALKPEEFTAATINITNREQRLENLHRQYVELEDHYRYILNRVAEWA